MSGKTYLPSEEFSNNAVLQENEFNSMHGQFNEDPEEFWRQQGHRLNWIKDYSKVKNVDFSFPHVSIKWFEDGVLNICENCVDRHLEAKGNDTAIIWEGDEPTDSKFITYNELYKNVSKLANSYKSLGVRKGDRIIIYMPMIPEAAYAMLASARIGAIHSVVFAGFSPDALSARIQDCEASLVITADEAPRGGKVTPLKLNVDQALKELKDVKTIVVPRTGSSVPMLSGRDYRYEDLMKNSSESCAAEPMQAEDPLFILYTSGSTGKPKGVQHSSAGYLLYASMTHKYIFDYKDGDIYWCTADVGWVTGHSYIVYGPLSNGATTLMYEGVPRPSNLGAFWQIVQKYHVSIFYTAPTAIRSFMKSGREIPDQYNLSSLRILGTVGEPINPEAWIWYHNVIGQGKCPIVDTWWQTETGGVMISPLPGALDTKPGSATLPLPGIEIEIVSKEGKKVDSNEGGYLIVKKPWPGMMRTIHGNPDRYLKSYWEFIPYKEEKYVYFAGDGARIDNDGYIWIMGRVDDVISVSGHRLGTMEIESALVSHKSVAEAAVVGRPDNLKGEVIVAFVSLEKDFNQSQELVDDLKLHVVKEIGIIAKPEKIIITDALPKTRSGKIMRRILRSLASGEKVSGDISTLEDSSVLEKLKENS